MKYQQTPNSYSQPSPHNHLLSSINSINKLYNTQNFANKNESSVGFQPLKMNNRLNELKMNETKNSDFYKTPHSQVRNMHILERIENEKKIILPGYHDRYIFFRFANRIFL